jgi:hypothetical protein
MKAACRISLVTLVVLLQGYGCRPNPSASSAGRAILGVWAGQVTSSEAAGFGAAGSASGAPAAPRPPSWGEGPVVWTFYADGSYRCCVYWDQNYVIEMGGAYFLEGNRLWVNPIRAAEGTYRTPPDATPSGLIVASIHASRERAKAGKESFPDLTDESALTWTVTGDRMTLTENKNVMLLTRKQKGYVPEVALVPSFASTVPSGAPASAGQTAPADAPDPLKGDKSDVLVGRWVGEDTISYPPLGYTYAFDARGRYQLTVTRNGQQERRSGVYRLVDGVLYLDEKPCRTTVTGDTLRIGDFGSAINLTHQR